MLQHAGRGARGRYVQAGQELFRQRGQRHHAGSHHHPRAWTQVSTSSIRNRYSLIMTRLNAEKMEKLRVFPH